MNLTKLVGDFVEGQKIINAQLSHKIDTMENNVNKRIDGLQSEMEHKADNLQYSISRLTNQQHVHQEEESQEEECLSDTMVEEQCQQQLLSESLDICVAVYQWKKEEEILPLLSEEGNGKEAGEDPQKPISQATDSPLPSPDPMHTLPSPAAQFTPEAIAPKDEAIPSALPVQYFKKLVATAQIFATTSKKLAAAHIAWHSGWFGCWFRHGAPGPQQSHKLHQFQQPPKA